MAAPLTGRRVVVTRSAQDNAPLAATLAEQGAEVINLPLTEVIGPVDGGRALAEAVDRLADYRYVTLTSANGVRALAAALADRPWPADVTVAPVGPVTAALAEAAGMTVGPAPAVATAAGLVEAFPIWTGSGACRVLAPLAALAGDTVVHGLAGKGYAVDRVEAYQTVVPSPEQLVAGRSELQQGADAALFFSPSAVDRFVELASSGETGPDIAICIGPSTAARAAEHRPWQVVTATPHTEVGVLQTLLTTLGCGEPTAES